MKPIIFSAPMVRAILGGRKSQTRRVVKPQPNVRLSNIEETNLWSYTLCEQDWKCTYGKPGDILWVRETFYKHKHIGMKFSDEYEALPDNLKPYYRKCSSIFMSKWTSRITLKISNVRVERLQDITLNDVNAEGVGSTTFIDSWNGRHHFALLWDSINKKKHPWASNPWVWVIEFERVGS